MPTATCEQGNSQTAGPTCLDVIGLTYTTMFYVLLRKFPASGLHQAGGSKR